MAVAAAQTVVRAGLEAVVRGAGGLEFAGVFSLVELEARVEEIAADVLIIELPRLDEDWTALLAGDSIPIVLLTETPDAAALRAGVRAILSTDATAAEIAAAVSSAAIGLITVQASMIGALGGEARSTPAALEEPLSPREREVLGLLAEGLSNKVLAYRLGISEHTVKFHVTSIMAKLGAASRTDAVMQGIRRGLILI